MTRTITIRRTADPYARRITYSKSVQYTVEGTLITTDLPVGEKGEIFYVVTKTPFGAVRGGTEPAYGGSCRVPAIDRDVAIHMSFGTYPEWYLTRLMSSEDDFKTPGTFLTVILREDYGRSLKLHDTMFDGLYKSRFYEWLTEGAQSLRNRLGATGALSCFINTPAIDAKEEESEPLLIDDR